MTKLSRSEKIKFLNSLLTVQEVCKMFNVSGQSVHNWKRTRGFPAYEIRGFRRQTLRFDLSEVEAWAAKNGLRPQKFELLKGVDRRHHSARATKHLRSQVAKKVVKKRLRRAA